MASGRVHDPVGSSVLCDATVDAAQLTLLWAKLPHGSQTKYHPLVFHLLDTGHVADRLCQTSMKAHLRTWLGESFGVDDDTMRRWAAFWASLHDIGKATPSFQRRAESICPPVYERIKAAGYSFRGSDRRVEHGRTGREILLRILRRFVSGTRGAERLARVVATITSGHHGVFFRPDQMKGLSDAIGDGAWQRQQVSLSEFLAKYWGVQTLAQPVVPEGEAQAACMVMAGLISVADWIASCEKFFPYAGQDVALSDYAAHAVRQAEKAVSDIGWDAWSLSRPADFREFFGFSPNAMQRVVMEAGRGLSRPGLFVVEAPMGLGKTEAAFRVAEDLLRRIGHQGVYIALPTQTTSNQMLVRFGAFARRLVGEGTANLALVHGQSILNQDYRDLRIDHAGSDDPAAPVAAQEWFASSKRGLLSPLAVGTVDQGLLSILQTRHHFVRLFGLAGKVVILDEVHAYDTYTSELLKHLIHWLGAMGCSVILLSATLPRRKRQELLAAYRAGQPPMEECGYPRITVAGEGLARTIAVPDSPRSEIHLQSLASGPRDVAARLVRAIRPGGCAAWICNTVQRAQDVYGILKTELGGMGCDLSLLHARLPYGWRRDREQTVVSRHGKIGWRPDSPADLRRPARAVVIATQVIEQSLDLDFDIMVSDLAPVDLVLQRAGRLHRHREVGGARTPRPAGLEMPQVWLAVPSASPRQVPSFGIDEWVYERYILLRSYLSLVCTGRGVIRVPDDLEGLIEEVYGDSAAAGVDRTWHTALEEAKAELDRVRGRDAFLARCGEVPCPSDEDLLTAFNLEAPDDEAEASRWNMAGLTRKAAKSVRLICLHRVGGGLCLDSSGRGPVSMEKEPGYPEILALLEQSVSITRAEVVRHFSESRIEPPAAWRGAPVLRHCRPMILEDGRTEIGRIRVRLDPELGIVFETGGRAPEGD